MADVRRPPVYRWWFGSDAGKPAAERIAGIVARGEAAGYTPADLAAAARFLDAQPTALACVVLTDGSVVEYAEPDPVLT